MLFTSSSFLRTLSFSHVWLILKKFVWKDFTQNNCFTLIDGYASLISGCVCCTRAHFSLCCHVMSSMCAPIGCYYRANSKLCFVFNFKQIDGCLQIGLLDVLAHSPWVKEHLMPNASTYLANDYGMVFQWCVWYNNYALCFSLVIEYQPCNKSWQNVPHEHVCGCLHKRIDRIRLLCHRTKQH